MAEPTKTGAPKKRRTTPKKTTASKKTAASPKPRKPAAKKPAPKETTAMTKTADNRTEAKSRFNAALEEAKAGAAALKAEGKERAVAYRDQAKGKGEDWVAEAKAYGEEAKVKGKELAVEGKAKMGEGMRALSRLVNDNAYQVDDKVGAKYGDYARTASKSLGEYADRLDAKSVDDLVEDGREFVRKSPGKALGIAAIAGFLLSRLFRRSR
jgi:ElaB/YqjD/DUF883 family membrane-anchored ribosome-binding protein